VAAANGLTEFAIVNGNDAFAFMTLETQGLNSSCNACWVGGRPEGDRLYWHDLIVYSIFQQKQYFG
jgi:hypothetical protein